MTPPRTRDRAGRSEALVDLLIGAAMEYPQFPPRSSKFAAAARRLESCREELLRRLSQGARAARIVRRAAQAKERAA